ncbi:MAG: hypothetical protein JNJ61_12680 [Anaerolineae bacterium]|nr:hypothetical protein [Anaerolineae bacterium]
MVDSRNATEKQKQQEHRCPYCQREFKTLDDLTLHVVTRHTQTGIPRPAPTGPTKR